jgi:DNA-binding MarR family transcriptional regulator
MFLMGGSRGIGPSLKMLTEHLRLDKSTVSRLVRKMSAEGLVDVEVSPSDGRAKGVSLTQSGQELAAQVDRTSLSLFEGLVARLSTDEPEQITTLLGQLTSAIRASCDTTPHEISGSPPHLPRCLGAPP